MTRRWYRLHRHQFLILLLIQYLRTTSSRTWMDAIDPTALQNDGMPRVPKPIRNKTAAAVVAAKTSQSQQQQEVQINIHGSTTTLFTEVDPFRITGAPSAAPSYTPSYSPSATPSSEPTTNPSSPPTQSSSPTSTPTSKPTLHPTSPPTFSTAQVPSNPNSGYFNYDLNSKYGPRNWKNIAEIKKSDPGYFWHTFSLGDDNDSRNDCGSDKKQSPIDVCTSPKDTCTETHEMRPKSGDYKMNEELIDKQILSNKLRLVMTPRTGEEPDPPQIDFSSNGRGIMDMTNIDFKIPSEHTVCGKRFDAEMQYFTYHPARERFVAVSFFLDGSTDGNVKNEHLQEVIDAFKVVYREDDRECEKRGVVPTNSFAGGFASGNNNQRNLLFEGEENGEEYHRISEPLHTNSTASSHQSHRRLALKWHPFHPDIQKTVHFWGYSGSLTDPPCTKDIVDWKIMDVPTPISSLQLAQLKHILFTHVNPNNGCRRTSVHNAQGSNARPTQNALKYYKCTRDDYVSDEERAVCGDEGCVHPFGSGLNRYYPPLVDVTGPPTRSPA